MDTNTLMKEIALGHHACARVLDTLGLNYCCDGGGRLGLEQACQIVGQDTEEVFARLEQAQLPSTPSADGKRTWAVAGLLQKLRRVTSVYLPPVDLCTSYRIALQAMENLDADLLRHIQLESALIPVLGGESVKALGFQFLLMPLSLNLAVMLAMSLAYQRLLLPKPIDLTTQTGVLSGRPTDRLGIQADDLRAALAEMDEFIDVGERELNEIYKLATACAFRRNFGETSAAEVMTPNPLAVEFGTELEEAWSLMQKHRIKALPVIDRGRHVIGIVTQSDFFRHARAKQFNSLGGKLKELLKASPTVTSQKPEVAGQIMTSPAVTAAATEHLPELARLLTERGIHQVPIVDARGKLAGMITQTDLIAALYRNMTGTPDKHEAQ